MYIAFCLYFNLTDFPAATGTLLIYAEFLLRTYTATKSVSNALSSLRTFHLIWGFPTLGFDNFQFLLWSRALPLTRRRAPAPAPALPLHSLRLLCARALQLGHRGRVFATLLVTAFYSLARLSSLVPPGGNPPVLGRVPLIRDLNFQPTQASLFLKWGKSAQHPSQGFWVPLYPVSDSPACPVTLLREQLHALRGESPDTPLFTYRQGTLLFSFTLSSARAYLKSLSAAVGLSGRGFTFHSLRRGGCTLAFTTGALRSDLQQLGGWKSDAIDSYLPRYQARQRAARLLARASSP